MTTTTAPKRPAASAPPRELVAAVGRARTALITSHVSPDGDSVGSSVALARLLESLGKRARIWHRDPSPTIYRALPGVETIHLGPAPPPELAAADLVVVLECPSLDRTGLAPAFDQLPIVNIDHHLGNSGYGEHHWIDVEAPAVAVMVAALGRELGAPLDATCAEALYLALFTDTGGFRFSNASPRALDFGADLARAGARPDRVARWVYESQAVATVRLLGELLQTLELHGANRVAYVELRPDMLQRAGAGPADSEGLIDVPRSIAGVQAVVLLRQQPDGSVKGSLRSHDPVDVEGIARRFGGGGHRNAAGFLVPSADLAAIKREILGQLVEIAS